MSKKSGTPVGGWVDTFSFDSELNLTRHERVRDPTNTAEDLAYRRAVGPVMAQLAGPPAPQEPQEPTEAGGEEE
jgi:hypothetical protein